MNVYVYLLWSILTVRATVSYELPTFIRGEGFALFNFLMLPLLTNHKALAELLLRVSSCINEPFQGLSRVNLKSSVWDCNAANTITLGEATAIERTNRWNAARQPLLYCVGIRLIQVATWTLTGGPFSAVPVLAKRWHRMMKDCTYNNEGTLVQAQPHQRRAARSSQKARYSSNRFARRNYFE